MLKISLTLFAALAFLSTSARSAEIRNVSMIQLIATPQKYHGLRVRVTAFLNLEFEGNALYLHREDFEKSLLDNAIWIELTDKQLMAATKLSGGYTLVEGTFSAKERGHFGMFSGSVRQVTRIQSWERQAK